MRALLLIIGGLGKTWRFKMQKIGFAEALDSIVASDPRYQREAYVFSARRARLHHQATEENEGRFRPARGRSGTARGRSPVRAEGIWADGRDGVVLLGGPLN